MTAHHRPPRPSGLSPLLRWWWSVDWVILLIVIMLMIIGVFLAMSVSAELTEAVMDFRPAWRHMAFCIVGLLLIVLLSLQRVVTIRRLGVLLALIGLGGLLLLPLLGTNYGKGAVRWFSVMGVSVQPVEFLKPGLVILVAWVLSATGRPELDLRRGLLGSVPVVLAVLLLVFQPDYGQSALIMAVWGALIFTAGAPMWLMLSSVGLVIGGGVLAYELDSHFRGRVKGFLTPSDDPTEQVNRSVEAIRQGNLFGVGPGEGVVKQVLPDAHTDFILAVVAEEFGLIITMAIVLAFATLTLRALWRARQREDGFARLSGMGLGLLIGLQAFINIGVAAKLLPTKGMTLPFISLGGSSTLATAISVGFLLAVTRRS